MGGKLVLAALCLMALALVANGAGLRAKRGLAEEAEKVIKQSGGLDVNNVGQLAELVAREGAEECLARVICELIQNPRVHGESGSKFAQSLLKFQKSKHPRVQKYMDAMNLGARATNSQECKSRYPQCAHPTQEVVQVGNKIFKD